MNAYLSPRAALQNVTRWFHFTSFKLIWREMKKAGVLSCCVYRLIQPHLLFHTGRGVCVCICVCHRDKDRYSEGPENI